MSSNHTIAAAVRAEMARQRKTQADAADALGMSQAAISRRLSGEVDFGASELVALATWLALPVATFLAGAA